MELENQGMDEIPCKDYAKIYMNQTIDVLTSKEINIKMQLKKWTQYRS